MKSKLTLVLLVVLLAFALSACTKDDPGPSKGGGSIDGIKDLEVGMDYRYDMNFDGKDDLISYSFEDNCLDIYINDENMASIVLGDDYYDPTVQLCDIDKEDNKVNLWAYCYAYSDDICYSALFEYDNKKLKKIWQPSEKKLLNGALTECNGILTAVNNDGNFEITMDRPFKVIGTSDGTMGNYFATVEYNLHKSKVTRVSHKTFKVYKAFVADEEEYSLKAGQGAFLTAREVTFHKDNSSDSQQVVLGKGEKVYPREIYIGGGQENFVKYETEDGQILWLQSIDDFDETYENPYFENLAYFD